MHSSFLVFLGCTWCKDATQPIDRACFEEEILHNEPKGLTVNLEKQQFYMA